MNIIELDAFNLADAVKFHDRLNPRLWDKREHLRPDVHAKLMEIAEDFKEFLGIDNLQVRDITISGSNAAFNYTPHSDIDLHIVADLPEADTSEVFRELFDAKKYQYNNQNDIRIGGYDVELYVQNPNQPHHSQGIYSLLQNKWLSVPKRRRAEFKDISVKSKYEDIGRRIESAIESGEEHQMDDAWAKLKSMRQQGLEQQGEFSPENLAFKLLRNNGTIEKLKAARQELKNKSLSLPEARQPVVYGFVTESPDGVNPSTKQILETEHQYSEQVMDFIRDTAGRLDIENIPEIQLHNDPEWSIDNHSFGMYEPESHVLHVNLHNRHLLDILRTAAHELAHCRQHEIESLTPSAGKTGSRFENEAHAVAGVIMRDYADANPELFAKSSVHENASGYIPKNKKEARDPRYSMAVSVDIQPGEVGRQANKLALQTGRNGEPKLLMKSANLRESRMPQPSQGPGQYRDLNAPLGPESRPTMPRGTVRVDVSDVYDWYKLGKHIPNLDRADPGEFGKGPPSTIVSFGDEDTEHKYIKDLEKLGLTTTDIDPVDPDQPKNIKRQKTDPTYNVAEDEIVESLRRELELLEDEILGEVKMTSRNLAQLARAIPGATVGLEFEMIVPNTDYDGDGEQEPDYDQDQRVRDIDDAVSFFDDGDYNGRNEIRRLREAMESDYMDWKFERLAELWEGNQGWEFFVNYIDREDPFDEEDAREQGLEELAAEYGDKLSDEERDKMLSGIVEQKRESYYQTQWDDQNRNYDYAQEEFNDEMVDDLSEEDWLDNQGIRYASDVENAYSIMWPYWSSPEGNDADVKKVALEFMNYMGYDTIAVGDYHGYGGGYELWNGSEWRKIGSNKPMDAFTVEPDGSLSGDDSGDTGLEFVSPPIPLDQIGDTMKRVQQWASENGVYTGKSNSTSMHTNISIPGYDLDKLDYLKAAILLGDEYVLRQFDRIGNSYAKPAIGKVKELVKQKPEKAQELLDKMKSHLNAEASKLIHSGQTDKYTSINTKDNRVEFRSPGGDYLSDIADNPQKMQDTINRMVVALDAAMDPEKYKQEYQKKLYKILTGQQLGREAKTGAKQEMKKDDKDLLNIFSRYAAGELPKAALKSFVRQAQLERTVAKGKSTGPMWWNVQWDANRRIEVVAKSAEVAKQVAAEEWGVPEERLAGATVTPLRPYKEGETTQQPAAQQPSTQFGAARGAPNWELVRDRDQAVVHRIFADNQDDAIGQASDFTRMQGWDPNQYTLQAADAAPVPGSTLDRARQRAAAAQQNQGNWGIWVDGASRFAREPGEYPAGQEVPLRRFPSREAAEQWLAQQRAERPGIRTDIEVREIEPTAQPQAPMGGQNYPRTTSSSYELYRISDGRTVTAPAGNPIVFQATDPEDAESKIARYAADFNLGAPQLFAVRSVLQVPAQQPDTAQGGIVDVAGEQPAAPQTGGSFTGEWKVLLPDGREVYRFSGVGNSQSDANRVAATWLRNNGMGVSGEGFEVLPVMG